MTREEAKTVFLNRGYVEVEGGTIYDADKWRESCRVISEWLEQEPKTGHWIVHEHAEEFYGRVVDDYECDNCGDWYLNKTNFCPNCGARMEVEKNG